MRIAFIGQKGIPAIGGGVERYVEDIAIRLVNLGHDVVVYTRPNYTPALLTNYHGVTLTTLPSIPTKHLDAISHTFFASLKAVKDKVDIVHYQSIGPALLCWLPKLLRPKTRVISTLQSRDYEHLKWGSFARFMLKLGERSMCRFSDELIVVTQSMRDYVKSEYGLDAVVIPNGSNLYNEVTSTHQLTSWGLEKNNYIVAISRLIRHKGISYLIEAYQQLKTNKKLVIVGTGSFTDDHVSELKTLAADEPNIIFTGSQTGETLAQLYQHAAVFVQPSESEGLSLALLEAMARSRPVLVSDIVENTQAIKEAGFVFKNKDSQDLATKLSWILEHPAEAETMGKQGRKIVEQHYNWDTIVGSILEIYIQAKVLKSPEYTYPKTMSVN